MILLLDTAARTARIGLAENDTMVAEDAWEGGQTLSKELLRRIEKLLASRGSSLADIRAIRVHAGPGGFTSLRIGVVTANVLGYALGVPVMGVTGAHGVLADLLRDTPPGKPSGPVVPVYDRPPFT